MTCDETNSEVYDEWVRRQEERGETVEVLGVLTGQVQMPRSMPISGAHPVGECWRGSDGCIKCRTNDDGK